MITFDTSDLEIGMYVSALDRPWVGTPFLFQSFLIKTEKQIQQLQKYCRTVEIDEEKSDPSLANKFFLYKCKIGKIKPEEEKIPLSARKPTNFSMELTDTEIDEELTIARQVYETTTT